MELEKLNNVGFTKFACSTVPFGTKYVSIGMATVNDEMINVVVSFIDTPNDFGAMIRVEEESLIRTCKRADTKITDISFGIEVNGECYTMLITRDSELQEYAVLIEFTPCKIF